jgi:hypothetical protein
MQSMAGTAIGSSMTAEMRRANATFSVIVSYTEKNPSSAQIGHRGKGGWGARFVEEGLVNRPFSESVSDLETYVQNCSERLRLDFTAPASYFKRNPLFARRLQAAAASFRAQAKISGATSFVLRARILGHVVTCNANGAGCARHAHELIEDDRRLLRAAVALGLFLCSS